MICVVTLSMPLISVAAASGWRPFAKVVAQETTVDLNSSSTDRNSAQVHCVTGFGNSAASVAVAAAAVMSGTNSIEELIRQFACITTSKFAVSTSKQLHVHKLHCTTMKIKIF